MMSNLAKCISAKPRNLRRLLIKTATTMKKYIDTQKKDTRSWFWSWFSGLGRTNPNVVALMCRLSWFIKNE